jgi:1-pyrroline-5-carboxylate dehydrogenase
VSDFEYVAWQSDHDAYGATGQKCSAQSIVFAHENWLKKGFTDEIARLSKKRKLEDLTCGPVITWNNKKIQEHVDKCASIPGAKVLFGGKPLSVKHNIPEVYGSYEPTAVQVGLEEFIKNF